MTDDDLPTALDQLNRHASAKNIVDISNFKKAAVVFAGTELKGLKVF